MTGDLRQVPLGARRVSVQLRTELPHTFTKPWLSETLRSMLCSTFATIT
jgi:hypothetical protein